MCVHCSSSAAHEDTKEDIQREINILTILKRGYCSNVVRMLDFGWDEIAVVAEIVMERVEYGSLVKYLRWSGAKIRVSYIGTVYRNQIHDIMRTYLYCTYM